jgi:Protein of unknown function (DUF1569)
LSPPDERAQRRWERAVREHRAALSAFVEAVARVDEEAWERPAGEGKWSPAEITEHLALAYEAALREVRGGGAMAPRVSTPRQKLLRWLLLPHMLYHRTMPRSGAPRETRPAPTGRDRSGAVERLRRLGEEAESVYAASREARLTHPYFGPLDRSRTFRLVALHIEHHLRQLPGR